MLMLDCNILSEYDHSKKAKRFPSPGQVVVRVLISMNGNKAL